MARLRLPPRAGVARRFVLVCTLAGLLIGLGATIRLALVIAATPPSLWLAEDPRLVDPGVPITHAVAARADALTLLFRDSALIRGRLGACDVAISGADEACIGVIDDALAAAPSSGELWLFKATVLLRGGDVGQPMVDALRNSYLTAPREGWIASARVVLGLKLYPTLSPDLQDDVKSDLRIVLENDLAVPVAKAYAADFALRKAAEPALATLSPALMNRFTAEVRAILNDLRAARRDPLSALTG